MLTGLGIAVLCYVLVAISVIAVVPAGDLERVAGAEGQVLLNVVRIGAPDLPISTVFPFLTVVAVANTALINMLPGRRTPWVGIIFSTALALGLIVVVTFLAETSVITALSGTTALLLLGVFTVVNVACLVLRREPDVPGAFHAPRWTPWAGAVTSAFLVGPWARDREDWIQYSVGGGLLVLGVVLWGVTALLNRRTQDRSGRFDDVGGLGG